MSTHSSILGWRIPWTEEPGGLQSMGSQRVGHDWATNTRASSITRGEEGLWGVAGFLWGVHCLSGGLTSCSDLKMKAMAPWGVSDAGGFCLIRTSVSLRGVTCIKISTGSSKAKLQTCVKKLEACLGSVWNLQCLTVDLGCSLGYYQGTPSPPLRGF